MPVLAVSVCEYGAVASPLGREAVVMEGPAMMVRDRVLESFPPKLSVTLKVIEGLPAAVGVPLIRPVEGVSESPAGSEPELCSMYREPSRH
jgi:hypothetical protein